MNSDDPPPYSAFGIEDPPISPSASEREQQRWIDAISAVIAVDGSKPIAPSAAMHDAIQWRIDAPVRSLRRMRLLAWSGWAAAAMLCAGFFLLDERREMTAREDLSPITSQDQVAAQQKASLSPSENRIAIEEKVAMAQQAATDAQALQESMRAQQRSLIQEIETLREKVSVLAARDTERLVANDGISWPIIMKLTHPEADPATVAIDEPLLGVLLAPGKIPTVAGMQAPLSAPRLAGLPPAENVPINLPSAVPVYDPARDTGQLIVSNLPVPADGQAYYFWVKNDQSEQPVLVGTLPSDIAQSETFDFRLGSTGMIPNRFMITQDPVENPQSPAASNIILDRPQK
jgi:hypothetical protein